jgi:hypothetical protein
MRPWHEEHHGPKACHDANPCPMLRTGVRDIDRAAPLEAQARAKGHTGLLARLQPHPLGPLPRDAMEVLARADRRQRDTSHALYDRLQSLCHMGRCWGALAGVPRQGAASGGRATARDPWAPWRWDQHRGQKRGDGLGYAGHNHQQGEQVIAIIDNPGDV